MIRTLPELARVWWTLEDAWPGTSTARVLLARPLASTYSVSAAWPEDRRVQAAARAVQVMADRLSRLPHVWDEWDPFDPGAFLDLYEEQADVLVSIRQTHNRVQVFLFVDLLVPAVQAAEIYWSEQVVPALHVAQPVLFSRNGTPDVVSHTWAELVAREVAPEMETRIYAAAQEIRWIRETLYQQGDACFLGTSASLEERYRVSRDSNGRLDNRLWERLQMVPTLTLELTFVPGGSPEMLRRRALRRWRGRPWRRCHAR